MVWDHLTTRRTVVDEEPGFGGPPEESDFFARVNQGEAPSSKCTGRRVEIDVVDQLYVGLIHNVDEERYKAKMDETYTMGVHLVEAINESRREA